MSLSQDPNEKLIKETIAFVKQELYDAEGGHDWHHIARVYKTARYIAEIENGDLLVIQLSALLHDIADAKFHEGDETIGPKIATEFLYAQKVPKVVVDHVRNIISSLSYRDSLQKEKLFQSKELDIVQDADRLDALGAIGIARTFNYGGFKKRKIYDPEIPPNLKMSKEEYKTATAPTINHFYEKLLLLKNLMRTKTGRILAENRHQFMEDYLEQFYKEWNSELP